MGTGVGLAARARVGGDLAERQVDDLLGPGATQLARYGDADLHGRLGSGRRGLRRGSLPRSRDVLCPPRDAHRRRPADGRWPLHHRALVGVRFPYQPLAAGGGLERQALVPHRGRVTRGRRFRGHRKWRPEHGRTLRPGRRSMGPASGHRLVAGRRRGGFRVEVVAVPLRRARRADVPLRPDQPAALGERGGNGFQGQHQPLRARCPLSQTRRGRDVRLGEDPGGGWRVRPVRARLHQPLLHRRPQHRPADRSAGGAHGPRATVLECGGVAGRGR